MIKSDLEESKLVTWMSCALNVIECVRPCVERVLMKTWIPDPTKYELNWCCHSALPPYQMDRRSSKGLCLIPIGLRGVGFQLEAPAVY